MTIEQIVNQYPKTDDCEFQTLKELREWQITELRKIAIDFADYYINSISNRNLKSIEKHFEDFNVTKKPKMKELIENIEQWAAERDLLHIENAGKQYLKFIEESGETARAILKKDEAGIIDGFGDMAVTLIILSKQFNKRQQYFLNETRGFYLDFSKLFSQVSSQYIDTLAIDTLNMTARGFGYDLEKCLNSAWNEIKNRQGKTVNGVFLKN